MLHFPVYQLFSEGSILLSFKRIIGNFNIEDVKMLKKNEAASALAAKINEVRKCTAQKF